MSTSVPDFKSANKGNADALPLFFLGVSKVYVTPNCLSNILKKEDDESYNQNTDCCDSDRTGYRNRSMVRV